MNKRLENRSNIWITGASSGIGEAVVHELAGWGHNLIVTGRRQEALDTLAAQYPDHIHPAAADTTSTDALATIAPELAHFGDLDMVILNAGTCEYLDAQDFDMALIKRVFDANLYGTLYCVEAALPLLRAARKEGGQPLLAATSSASAYVPLPRAEAYGGSKAAISYFLESLRLGLDQEGIRVSLIHPGFVKTPLTDLNDFPMPMRISAEQAADALLNGLAKGRLDIHFPRRFTYIVKLLGILPPRLRHTIGLRMTRSQGEPQ